MTLKPPRALLAKLAKLRRPLAATLSASLAAPGATAGAAKVAIRLG